MRDGTFDPQASAYEGVASLYERGRPSYPGEAVERLIAELRIRPGVVVADIGAGTGKFTRLLLPTGASVTAVEPVAAMRTELRKAVPGATVLEGTADALPFEDASLDVATAAQAFHWFGTDEAVAEILRALRPGGGLGLIWNRRDRSVPLWRDIESLIGPARPGRSIDWRQAIHRSRFGPLHHAEFEWEYLTTPAQVTMRVGSMSWVAALPDTDRLPLLQRVEEIAGSGADSEGVIALQERTEVFWTFRPSEVLDSGTRS